MKIITIISDLHVGSNVALCPPDGIVHDEGGTYKPNHMQRELWRVWQIFQRDTLALRDKHRCESVLIINGDTVDGNHHNTLSIATPDVDAQEIAAVQVLQPFAAEFDRVYMVRGTEAHDGNGCKRADRIARAIKATPQNGAHSTWQLWLHLKAEEVLLNVAHHISTTSSAAYESSAVMREMVSAVNEAGQWGQMVPDVIVRSHRHRFIEVKVPSAKGGIKAFVTPGWQLKTPYVERIDRMRMPHIGGVNLLVEDGECRVRERLFPLGKPKLTTF